MESGIHASVLGVVLRNLVWSVAEDIGKKRRDFFLSINRRFRKRWMVVAVNSLSNHL